MWAIARLETDVAQGQSVACTVRAGLPAMAHQPALLSLFQQQAHTPTCREKTHFYTNLQGPLHRAHSEECAGRCWPRRVHLGAQMHRRQLELAPIRQHPS